MKRYEESDIGLKKQEYRKMQNNFERYKYKRNYIILSILFLLFCIGWICFSWGSLTWKSCGIIVCCLFFIVVIYCMSCRSLDAVYSEVENISEIMTAVMEDGKEPPSEEYKEGAIGVLYTNFYKMVGVLKESRNREMNEKIFLRDIISDISHQLKTPLASLMVFVDLLLEDKVEDRDKQKQILSEAGNQLNRMEWMVLSMLKLARIEAGAIQFEKTEILLEPLLVQAVESVGYLVKEREQNILLECGEDACLLCDGDWLTEAIINLLKNASDYSPKGKDICLEVEQANVYTRIYIKDEGMGIPEKELPNIFKRFYRVNQEVNPNSVGIGLSLTKSIIEGMGGSIHVKSEEGKYTWFVLTFM